MAGTDTHLREFAIAQQQYVSQYIQLADAKAGAMFTVVSAVTGYLLSKVKFRDAILGGTGTWELVLACLTLVLLVTGALLSFAVIKPQLTRSGPGFIFFRSVSEWGSASSYLAAVEQASEADLVGARVKQCFDMSRVCTRKYERLSVGMVLSLAGIFAGGASLFILQL